MNERLPFIAPWLYAQALHFRSNRTVGVVPFAGHIGIANQNFEIVHRIQIPEGTSRTYYGCDTANSRGWFGFSTWEQLERMCDAPVFQIEVC